MNDLMPLENPDPPALFRPGGLDAILARVEADARSLVPDITTVKGRSAIASTAARVTKTKTYLDAMGKDLTADLKRQTGAVDAERKAMRDRLDALKREVRKPLDDWEQAEVDRIENIRFRIDLLRADDNDEQPSAIYVDHMQMIESVEIDDSFAEFQDEAQQAKYSSLYRLTLQRDAAKAREAEAARIEAERQELAAKAQKEREDRIAKEAAERATREAQESVARAERERVYAEQRVKDLEAKRMRDEAFAKVRAERAAKSAEEEARAVAERSRQQQEAAVKAEAKRIADEAKAKADADAARARDEAHREHIHAEIVDDIIPATINDRTIAEILCESIAAGKIRHLKIIY